jgi:hypothetical protein
VKIKYRLIYEDFLVYGWTIKDRKWFNVRFQRQIQLDPVQLDPDDYEVDAFLAKWILNE